MGNWFTQVNPEAEIKQAGKALAGNSLFGKTPS